MRRFRFIVNLLAIAVILFVGIALWSRSRAQQHGDSPADSLAILDRHVEAVDFTGKSLPEAAEALGEAAGVRIVVEPAAAKVVADLARRTDVTAIGHGGITLGENLQMMLMRFGLTYAVDPDGIRITTIARSPPVVRVYDVRDLQRKLSATIPLEDPPSRAAAAAPVASSQNLGIFVGHGTPSPPVKRTPQLIDVEAMDQIRGLILDSIARDDWTENGGQLGEIHSDVNGFLIVTQTRFVHRQIVELLAAIRRADTLEWREASSRGQP